MKLAPIVKKTLDPIMNELIDFVSIHPSLPFAELYNEELRFVYASGINYTACNGIVEKKMKKFSDAELKSALHYAMKRFEKRGILGR